MTEPHDQFLKNPCMISPEIPDFWKNLCRLYEEFFTWISENSMEKLCLLKFPNKSLKTGDKKFWKISSRIPVGILEWISREMKSLANFKETPVGFFFEFAEFFQDFFFKRFLRKILQRFHSKITHQIFFQEFFQ